MNLTRNMRQNQNIYSLLIFPVIVVMTLLSGVTVFQGFTHVDEPDVVFDIYRFLQSLSGDRHLIDLIWPDSGMNGPLGIWIYSPILVIFSYVLRLPIDLVLRGFTVLLIPLTSWILFKSIRRIRDGRVAFWTTAIFLVTPYYVVHNHLALGEVWYTFFLIISFFFLTRSYRKRDIYLAFFFFGLGFAYKFTYAPLLIMPVSYVLFHRKYIRPNWKDIFFGTLLITIGFWPLFIGLIIDGPVFLNRFRQLNNYTTVNLFSLVNQARINLSYGLGPLIMVLAALGIWRVFAEKKERKGFRGLLAITGLLIPIAFLLALKIVSFRYYYPLLIPCIYLASGGLEQLFYWSDTSKRFPIFFLNSLLFVTFFAQAYWTTDREIFNSHGGPNPANSITDGRSAWQAAGEYVLENSEDNEVIVAVNPASFYIFGKRPMALNPDYSGLHIDGGELILPYKMSGDRELILDETVHYFIIPENTYESGSIPESLGQELTADWDGGIVRVFRYKKASGSNSAAHGVYRYDLRTAVLDFSENGLGAPGRMVGE